MDNHDPMYYSVVHVFVAFFIFDSIVRCLILIPLSRILIAIGCVEITTKQSFSKKKIEPEPPEQIQPIIALASLQAKRKTSCNTMFVSIFICIRICC